MIKVNKIKIVCPNCSKVNDKLPSEANRPFCNIKCYRAYPNKADLVKLKGTRRTIINCKNCGSSKDLQNSRVNEDGNYCDMDCWLEWSRKNELGLFTVAKVRHAGEDNYNWKGLYAGYSSIHKQIKRIKGPALVCVDCGKRRIDGYMIQWSNQDSLYSRDPEDYVERCVKCHGDYDKYLPYGMKDWFDNKGNRVAIPSQWTAQ